MENWLAFPDIVFRIHGARGADDFKRNLNFGKWRVQGYVRFTLAWWENSNKYTWQRNSWRMGHSRVRDDAFFLILCGKGGAKEMELFSRVQAPGISPNFFMDKELLTFIVSRSMAISRVRCSFSLYKTSICCCNSTLGPRTLILSSSSSWRTIILCFCNIKRDLC